MLASPNLFRRTCVALVGSLALVASLAAGPSAADSPTEIAGVIDIEHGDSFGASGEPQREVEYHVLVTAGERLTIDGSAAQHLPAGYRVKLRGERRGGRFVLAASGGVISATPSATSTASTSYTAVGAKRLAVLVTNFASDTGQPWTLDAVRNVLFGPSSAATYWSEASDGQTSLTGDVYGYYTLGAGTATCDYATWMSAAKSAATAAGVVLTDYTNVMVVFPRQTVCSWGGLGNVGGRNTWINGSMTTYVTSHELGHNFGVHHANSLECTDAAGARVALSSTCTSTEYGDPFDVMGKAARHPSNWHLRELGILSSADQQTVTTNGTYTVATVEQAGGTPRVLRVARPSGDFFYLEWRQPFGAFDNFAPTAAVVNGVLVREAPDAGTSRSQLVDTTPATTSFFDAPLALGQTFVDPLSNIAITTVALTATQATVSVVFEPLQPSATPTATPTPTPTPTPIATPTPTPTPTPSPTPTPVPDTQPPSAVQNLTVAVTRNKAQMTWLPSVDNSGYVSYQLYIDNSLYATTTTTSYLVNLHWGNHSVVVRAVDRAGNASPNSNVVTVSVSH